MGEVALERGHQRVAALAVDRQRGTQQLGVAVAGDGLVRDRIDGEAQPGNQWVAPSNQYYGKGVFTGSCDRYLRLWDIESDPALPPLDGLDAPPVDPLSTDSALTTRSSVALSVSQRSSPGAGAPTDSTRPGSSRFPE